MPRGGERQKRTRDNGKDESTARKKKTSFGTVVEDAGLMQYHQFVLLLISALCFVELREGEASFFRFL